MFVRWTLLLLFAFCCSAADFDADIRPIFMAKCVKCHSGDTPAAGLNLSDGRAFASRSGAAAKVAAMVASGKMPLGGPALETSESDVIAAWVRGGARWGADIAAPAKKVWWAFQAPVKPEVPKVEGASNPIDAFLLARLREKGLDFSPRAEARVLIRRLHFSLTGLPPAPEDYEQDYASTVERLLASPAYGERWARHWLDVVRYGETDGGEHNYERPHAWRYRDYVIDALNADIPYTQFIREQLTGDLIAPTNPKLVAATGFLVAGPWDQVSAELNKDLVMKKTARMDELDDMLTTTFHSFQALTVNCARCHDHKFDPIPTRDYYALTAVFGGVAFGNREAATADEKAAYDSASKPLKAELSRLQTAIDAIELPVKTAKLRKKYEAIERPPLNPIFNRNRFTSVSAKQYRLVITGHTGKLAKVDDLVLQPAGLRVSGFVAAKEATSAAPVIVPIAGSGNVAEMVWSCDGAMGKNDGTVRVYSLEASDDGVAWRAIASSLDHVSSVEVALPSISDAETAAGLTADQQQRLQALQAERSTVRKKLDAIPAPAMVYGAKPASIEKAFVLERGSVAKPKDEVLPGALTALAHRSALFGEGDDRSRRAALADWIADARNPMTARVIVNRVWYYHFGNGIVNTPSDFGVMGDRPSHPELLDWLAVSFMENGWSLKWLHRQIVSSRAYQQSSAMNAKAFAMDADNRMVWRMPLRRMDAETLRDSILSVSGSLNPARSGPGYLLQKRGNNGSYIYAALDNDGPEVWRRAVYRFVVRGGERIFMDSFDCPDPSVATPQRSASNTPVQALSLLNHAFVLKQAQLLAERLQKDSKTVDQQVARAYRVLFGRAPSEAEQAAGVEFVHKHSLALYARVLLNTNEFVYTP
jgi:hypothetical protein